MRWRRKHGTTTRRSEASWRSRRTLQGGTRETTLGGEELVNKRREMGEHAGLVSMLYVGERKFEPIDEQDETIGIRHLADAGECGRRACKGRR